MEASLSRSLTVMGKIGTGEKQNERETKFLGWGILDDTIICKPRPTSYKSQNFVEVLLQIKNSI